MQNVHLCHKKTTKMLTKIQKTTWERLQADVKRTTTQTVFFVISRVKVLLKRPQRDKKVIFLNTVTMATRCCSDLQQRRDVTWTTWRTLTFSLCKTVNCVCSQTPVKHRQAEVQRFDLWNVTVQARRTKPTKQSWSGAHNPPVFFLIQTHLTGVLSSFILHLFGCSLAAGQVDWRLVSHHILTAAISWRIRAWLWLTAVYGLSLPAKRENAVIPE